MFRDVQLLSVQFARPWPERHSVLAATAQCGANKSGNVDPKRQNLGLSASPLRGPRGLSTLPTEQDHGDHATTAPAESLECDKS